MDSIISDHQAPQAQNHHLQTHESQNRSQIQPQLQSPFHPESPVQSSNQYMFDIFGSNIISASREELDRIVIRYLLKTYSPDNLSRIFHEETRNPSKPDQSDRSSLISNFTASTAISEQSSIFDSASSVRSVSDTSSISSASIFSSVSSKFLGRKSSHALSSKSQPQISLADAVPNSSKQKTTFSCGFCSEEDIVKTCTRKNDLKRHMEDFHNTNAQWSCRHRGCQAVFDWQTAYKAHLKQCHGGSRMSLDEAKVNLCPQVVFACGFSKCQKVFEAVGDTDAPNTFKDYVAHVVKHFDDGAQSSGSWSYNTRMRNLLRQNQVSRHWQDYGLSNQYENQLNWSPVTSLILRKRLECRHIGDPSVIVHYAVQLGTNYEAPVKTHQNFVTPLKESCTMPIPGHINNSTSAAGLQDIPQPLNFRIPRGPNPGLASYIASQRRLGPVQSRRASRAQHYSSRSAGVNPNLASSSSSAGFHSNQYYQAQNIPVSREPSLYDNQPHDVFGRGRDGLMPQTSAIMTDDIQSLCTLASGSPESGDISMADADMLTRDFHHDYSSLPSVNAGLSGGDMTTTPASLGHPSHFFEDPTQARPY
ncbi:hypothetical protein CFIMG_006836RA [Ceratocystis fimbriata CBS 114723]|uniref:C2H2-type domain-containing protein n=1 Tax=Ceratocystis fimbriata CBS 114723 TaxID=1035309 RepID=A0A2C5WVB5_9PEZI|nr:hypothetical protein CFIMG_006836RA [Ceratocystis fimbriata CBS 114723]